MTIASISKSIAWFCICITIIFAAGVLLPLWLGLKPFPPALALLLGAGVGLLAGALEIVEGEK